MMILLFIFWLLFVQLDRWGGGGLAVHIYLKVGKRSDLDTSGRGPEKTSDRGIWVEEGATFPSNGAIWCVECGNQSDLRSIISPRSELFCRVGSFFVHRIQRRSLGSIGCPCKDHFGLRDPASPLQLRAESPKVPLQGKICLRAATPLSLWRATELEGRNTLLLGQAISPGHDELVFLQLKRRSRFLLLQLRQLLLLLSVLPTSPISTPLPLFLLDHN